MVTLKKTPFVARSGEGMFADGMWIFYLEALLVLALGLFIVWWTMPKKRPPVQAPQGAAQPVDSASARKTPGNEASANKAAAQPASGNTTRQG